MRFTTPRLVIAGLSGDSGKTLVTLGLMRAFKKRGLRVSPFKKGPICKSGLGKINGKKANR